MLVRIDSNGNLLWSESYGGNGHEEFGSINSTSDGGFIISGYTNSFGPGNTEIILVKTDSSGLMEWSKSYGNTGFDNGQFVMQTGDGGFLTAGAYTDPAIQFYSDVILMKTDSAGNLLWAKTYGGPDNDVAEQVILTSDGGYLITGGTWSFGFGNRDIFVMKTDSVGNLQWAKAYGWPNTDGGWSLSEDAQGYVVSGTLQDSVSIKNYSVLLHINLQGNLNWIRSFNDSTYHTLDLVRCADNGYGLGFSPSYNGSIIGTSYALIKTNSQFYFGCSQNIQISETSVLITPQVPVLTVTSGGGNIPVPLLTGSGGTVVTSCFTSGLQETDIFENISLYPIPSTGQFQFKNLPTGQPITVCIYDPSGREVSAPFKVGDSEVVDFSKLSTGYYYMHVELAGNKNRAILKLIIIR